MTNDKENINRQQPGQYYPPEPEGVRQPRKPRPKRQPRAPREYDTMFGAGFSELLSFINKFSFVISIFAIILVVVTVLSIGDSINVVNMKLDDLNEGVGNLNNRIDGVATNVSAVKGNINSLDSRIIITEGQISDLSSLSATIDGLIEELKNSLKTIEGNITNITDELDDIDAGESIRQTTDADLTFTFYRNQFNVTSSRYCKLEFEVENNAIDLGDIVYSFQYPELNISLVSWMGNIKPDEKQWNWSDYYLHWYGMENDVSAVYNLTWDIADYNSTSLNTNLIKDSLRVNSIYLTPNIEKVFVD